MRYIILIIIGFAEGLVIGSALIAFLLVLNIMPRLIRFASSKKYIRNYQILVVLGSFIATSFQFYDWELPQIYFFNYLLVIIIGFIFGIFVGLIAGALTETLKVLPVLSSRLGLKDKINVLLLFIILGKVIGALIYWIFPGLWP